MSLSMIPFHAEKIKINQIFKSEELDTYKEMPVASNKIRSVYGNELCFPESKEDRPYIFSSFVTSIDGKLAYADKPSAFYVAGKNRMAGGGKDTDFWILNALRGVCDAAIIGGNSMKTDADYSMHCMDADIESDRISAGLSKIPLNIVMTLDAADVPMDHALLKSTGVPCILVTSPNGLEYLKKNFKREYIVATEQDTDEVIQEKLSKAGQGILPVLITGTGGFPDSSATMKILKMYGINRLLIESPGYGHFLVKQKMMDEFFLNMSAVYIGGGDTMTLGKSDKGFLAEAHPHTKILSIHMYNEYFAYFRYKFNYDFL
ncbi:MAG: dihydrofolate reductase family protein [Hespellia sp.]|nr:dihydrofolate reductase family protein [Hespellia sp.]